MLRNSVSCCIEQMNGERLVVDPTPEVNGNRWAVDRSFKLEESWDAVELFKSRIRLRRANCIKDETQGVEISIAADDVVDKE